MDPTGNFIHRCLVLQDIFELIASELYGYPSFSKEGRKSLAYLARTCKILNHYTLPVLWQRLYSLVPLLRLFPGGWTESPGEHTTRSHLHIRSEEELDWTVYWKYAPFVKEFYWVHHRNYVDVTLDTLQLLSREEGPLLPNLTRVQISENSLERLDTLSFLLKSHHITHIYLHNAKLPLPSSIRDRLQVCKYLKELSLDFLEDTDGATRLTLLPWLKNHDNLRSFNSEIPLTDDWTWALASLPYLTDVTMAHQPQEVANWASALRSSESHEGCFPVLREFMWYVDNLDDRHATILENLQTTHLRTLRIKLRAAHPNTEDIRNAFEAISRSRWGASLEYLWVDGWTTPPAPLVFLCDALRPLFRFHNIRYLMIWLMSVELRGAAVTEVVNAFPHLKDLVVWRNQHGVGQSMSLTDLLTFAAKCPELAIIEARIHLLNIPSDAEIDRALPSASRSALTMLKIGVVTADYDAGLPDVKRIASFLTRLFPLAHLKCVVTPPLVRDTRSNETHRRLQDLMKLLKNTVNGETISDHDH